MAPFSFAVFYKTPFNQDVSNWNTGAVTNMLSMFGGAAAFNQDVSNWNTGAVVEMSYSKCILSLPLGGIYDNSILTHFVIYVVLWWHPRFCSVFRRICVQSGRVQMEYGCGDKNARQ